MKNFTSALIFLFTGFGLFAQTNIPGCTDPEAVNYNAQATVDDFSCCFEDFFITFNSTSNASLLVYDNQGNIFAETFFPGTAIVCLSSGCRTFYLESEDGLPAAIEGFDQFGGEYFISTSPGISTTEDFILGEGIVGCMVPGACNYNPLATCYAACEFECLGCTNPLAFNYNPNATVDDGSCCTVDEHYYAIQADGIVSFAIYDSYFGLVAAGTYPETQGFCYDQECFEINIYSVQGQTNQVSIINQGEVVISGTVSLFQSIFVPFSSEGETGCSDPNACNYNPAAACNDYTQCTYDCYGCTDPNAVNFDPTATVDDGSCCSIENQVTFTSNAQTFIALYTTDYNYYTSLFLYPGEAANICLPYGCYAGTVENWGAGELVITGTNSNGENIVEVVTSDWDAAIAFTFNAIEGCLDEGACNYNPEANCNDLELCTYDCFGCTDPSADNYNPSATIDDGSCCDELITITANSDFQYWVFSPNYSYYNGGASTNNAASLCLPSGCFYVYVNDFNNIPLDYSLTSSDAGLIVEVTAEELEYAPFFFDNNSTPGCIDPSACNFNPSANCVDYSTCDYSCLGCTDETALNFNASATIDNGTCCYNNYFTLQLSGEAYWSVASNNAVSGYTYGQYPQQSGFCIDSDCFSLYLYSFDGLPIEYTLIDQFGNIVASGTNNGYEGIFINLSENEIIGCSEPSACNYNPNVTCGNWYLCDYSCYGCTDENASNYDVNATINNGTCCYDAWYNISLSSYAYWTVYNFNEGFYASGFSPDQTGWCGLSDCFQLEIYSFTNETITYTITNSNGEVIAQGATNGETFYSISFSQGSEIAGCTDPNACNYNPQATCDTGNCNITCVGCTNPEALNYNPVASFDDGSCVFELQAPMIGFSVDAFAEQGVYYVRASVMSLGNGAPYLLGTSDGSQMTMVNSNGQYILGPFSCNEDVVVNLNSTTMGMTEFMATDPFNGNCISLGTEEGVRSNDVFQLYPNPANDQITIAGLPEGSFEIIITDMMGRVIIEQQWNNVNQGTLNVSSLSNGVYQLSLYQKDKVQTKKLIIER